MKIKSKIILLFIAALLQNCGLNDCNQECFTPPTPFHFEFVDAKTGENLFTNLTFNKNDITVKNTLNNTPLNYVFIDENKYNIVSIGEIGWKTEIVEFTIKVADKEIVTFYVNAKRLDEDCCSFTRYEEIRVENAKYTFNSQKEIYTILVD